MKFGLIMITKHGYRITIFITNTLLDIKFWYTISFPIIIKVYPYKAFIEWIFYCKRKRPMILSLPGGGPSVLGGLFFISRFGFSLQRNRWRLLSKRKQKLKPSKDLSQTPSILTCRGYKWVPVGINGYLRGYRTGWYCAKSHTSAIKASSLFLKHMVDHTKHENCLHIFFQYYQSCITPVS